MINTSYLNQMINGLDKWLQSIQFCYMECNYVPEKLLMNNHHLNVILRTFFRLFPINIRGDKKGDTYPLTPQANVALLKAYNLSKNKKVIQILLKRIRKLRSTKTKHFALKQGIKISISLYENDKDDPTPLNTVWFGQFLLEEQTGIFSKQNKKKLLLSISDYLIEELGYNDHYSEGVYFYYGPTLKKEIYNASALISAFLLRVGHLYDIQLYKTLGERGIQYIVNKQNDDGSWFYASPPERKSIDCFHQSYILQALCIAKDYLPFDISISIEKGTRYYRQSLFKMRGDLIIPIRYDKRYLPRNTWLFQSVDGRDIAEALVFFSKYSYDETMINGLLSYLHKEFYDKKTGAFASEILIWGKNKIPYIEFQAWFLYSLETVSSYIKKDTV